MTDPTPPTGAPHASNSGRAGEAPPARDSLPPTRPPQTPPPSGPPTAGAPLAGPSAAGAPLARPPSAGAPPWGGQQPAPMSTPSGQLDRVRPIGGVLTAIGLIVVVVSVTMRWSPAGTFAGRDLAAFRYAKAMQGDPAWTTAGTLLMIGLVVVLLTGGIAVLLSVIQMIARDAGGGLGRRR